MSGRTVGAAILTAVVALSCGAARQASFALAEPGCTQDPAACAATCRTQPGGGYCDVLTVLHAEQIVAQGTASTVPLQTLGPLHANLSAMCSAGIDRACAADEKIGPVVSKAISDRVAANQASQAAAGQAAQAQDAAKADFAARVDQVREGARDVLKSLGADEASCLPTFMGTTRLNCPNTWAERAGDIIGHVNQASSCGTNCTDQLTKAENELASLRQDIEAAKARLAEKQALDDAAAACIADVASCQSECSGNPGSLKCLVLADMADTGDAKLTKRRDPVRALDLAQKACCAGNTRACSFADSIQQKTTSLWTALQAVGDRLASNRYTLAMVLQLRPTPRNQRDVDTARRMEPSIIAAEYCPARAAFIEQVGLGEFQRRVAKHCKANPPTAQGPTGAQVPLPQQCAGIYATQCPGTPPGPPTPRTTEVTCCPNGVAAVSQRMGCACGDVTSGAQAPPPGPACSTHDPKAEGSACVWTCR